MYRVPKNTNLEWLSTGSNINKSSFSYKVKLLKTNLTVLGFIRGKIALRNQMTMAISQDDLQRTYQIEIGAKWFLEENAMH